MGGTRRAVPEGEDPRRIFSRRLGEAARLWRGTLDRELRSVNLSLMQWLTLSQLAEAGLDLVQKELAARVGIEGPAMVGILDRLVSAGRVERRVAPNDRRANTVHLTPAGERALEAAEAALVRVRDVLLVDLDDQALREATVVLGRVVARARGA